MLERSPAVGTTRRGGRAPGRRAVRTPDSRGSRSGRAAATWPPVGRRAPADHPRRGRRPGRSGPSGVSDDRLPPAAHTSIFLGAQKRKISHPLKTMLKIFFSAGTMNYKYVSFGHGLRTFTAVPKSTQPSTLHGTIK